MRARTWLAVLALGALVASARADGGKAPAIGEVFPRDNAWNRDISKLPVHPRSAAWVAAIGGEKPLHADFGTTWEGAPNGIPFCVVRRGQPRVPVAFEVAGESDAGPYPIPKDAPIEGGPEGKGDRHVLVVDVDERRLYEVWDAHPDGKGGWRGGSGAVFDLSSNALRPAGWTSADAAGLPIFPGLARHDEVALAGAVRHALRFTAPRTQRGYIEPARHFASKETDEDLPPMGARFRLKASASLAPLAKEARVIAAALQRYGMLLADNGSAWYVSGAPDPRWSDAALATLGKLKGSDFEAVETGEVVTK